jgi:hypothetical protein
MKYFVCTAALLLAVTQGFSQDIEPRRWSHLPLGSHFAGLGYTYAEGDIAFNPVLRIEDGEFAMHAAGFKYIQSFEWFGKSARFDLVQAYEDGTWEGILDGVPAEVGREGFDDTLLRLAVNLYGAPPLRGQEFMDYRKAMQKEETIVGMGLQVRLPTGEYLEDKLINLGTNRYAFTPQFGVVHTHGKWSVELSSSVSFYTENDEFLTNKRLEEDPYFVLQGHLIHTFRPGLWAGLSAGYGYGGESTIDGVSAHDRKENYGWGVSVGIPVNVDMGFKLGYIGTRTTRDTGADADMFTVACSFMW